MLVGKRIEIGLPRPPRRLAGGVLGVDANGNAGLCNTRDPVACARHAQIPVPVGIERKGWIEAAQFIMQAARITDA